MSELAITLAEINRYLDGVHAWVLKSKEGLTRDQAKRIFQRYWAKETPTSEKESSAAPAAVESRDERQARQIGQILSLMEQTTQRLEVIETDIATIKEKVDSILKRL
ncbi:MAG: hypothetical protein HUU16_03200 [Candidatus Omnitrophica bacterium]|nr:hypothetical protein [bacterium]NUN95158.1 hypothetical protein [Candidatus Omnitrophota bacterium]